MTARSVSIDDVAQSAGVSTKTVSRVINNEPNVTDKTKNAVLDAIKSLGYTPSISARSLASKRSYCISLLCWTTRSDYFSELQLAAMSACQARGYNLFALLIEDYHELTPRKLAARLLQLISRPRPDSVLLTPPFCDDATILEVLSDNDVPFVRISPFTHTFVSPYVAFDERRAARDITQYLIDLGHERIALIKGNPSHAAASARAQGYREALRDAGLAVDPSIILTGDFHFVSGLEAGSTLCALSDPPTAIFACNDEMAAGASVAAHRAGFDIPQDLSIVGFDDTAVAELTWPALTTIRQPLREMATEATLLAIDQKSSVAAGAAPEGVQLDYELIERESAAPPRAK